MDVLLDEDEAMLRDALRRYFEAESNVERIRSAEDRHDAFDAQLWASLGELGWLGLAFPSLYGGADAPVTQLALLFEEAGRALAPVPMHSHVVAGMAISRFGRESQRSRWLTEASNGAARLSFAWSEGGDVVGLGGIGLKAIRDGNGWRLSGEKHFVDGFEGSDVCVVAVRTDETDADGGVSLVLVEPTLDGLSSTTHSTLSGECQSTVHFDAVFVSDDAFVGEPSDARGAANHVFELAVMLNCSMIVGATRKAVERAVDYAKERVAFGKPIGAFQAIQHMCANMITWVDGAELLTREAAWLMANDKGASLAVSSAKAFVNERCQAALREANQIHGGVAQVREYDQQLWYRRAAAWSMRFGTSIEHRRNVARQLELGAE
jgi:alkylation response protein AidB-like acyl-CoA dehydrogenase